MRLNKQVRMASAQESSMAETAIRGSLEALTARQTVSSKNIVKMAELLQKQRVETATQEKSDAPELEAIIETLSSWTSLKAESAIRLFAFLICLPQIFAPFLLFLSAGRIWVNMVEGTEVKPGLIEGLDVLTPQQKAIYVAKRHVTRDESVLAQIFKTTATVIKRQLSCTDKKIKKPRKNDRKTA